MTSQTDEERDDAFKFVNNFLNKKPNKRTGGFLDSKWFYYLSKGAKWYLKVQLLKDNEFQKNKVTGI